LDQMERFRESARLARRERWNVRNVISYFLLLAGRPSEAAEQAQKVLQSNWARNVAKLAGQDSLSDTDGDELSVLSSMHNNRGTAYGVLKRFDSMLKDENEEVRLSELLVKHFPQSVIYQVFLIEGWAHLGWANIGFGHTNEGLALLEKSRR